MQSSDPFENMQYLTIYQSCPLSCNLVLSYAIAKLSSSLVPVSSLAELSLSLIPASHPPTPHWVPEYGYVTLSTKSTKF